MQAQVLAAHNELRTEFGLSPLRWDSGLANEAESYAKSLAERNEFSHSNTNAGENLWMGTRGQFALSEMVGGWSSEQRFFSPGVFPNVSRAGSWEAVGHFTQMVWPTTRSVGCGLASNGSDDFLVCRYWPAGNVVGDALPLASVRPNRVPSTHSRQ
jgi:hypothetical protein